MRERIYGPILKHISLLLKSIREVENYPNIEAEMSFAKVILADHLFFATPKKLGDELFELLEKHEKYQRILMAKEGMLHDAIREETKKTLAIDIGLDARQLLIRLEIGNGFVSELTLFQAVLLETSPKEFIKAEREKWGPSVILGLNFYPKSQDIYINKFELLFGSVLNKVKNEPIFIEEKKMRENLKLQMEKYLKEIMPFVNL
jgi:hypothetical protein